MDLGYPYGLTRSYMRINWLRVEIHTDISPSGSLVATGLVVSNPVLSRRNNYHGA